MGNVRESPFSFECFVLSHWTVAMVGKAHCHETTHRQFRGSAAVQSHWRIHNSGQCYIRFTAQSTLGHVRRPPVLFVLLVQPQQSGRHRTALPVRRRDPPTVPRLVEVPWFPWEPTGWPAIQTDRLRRCYYPRPIFDRSVPTKRPRLSWPHCTASPSCCHATVSFNETNQLSGRRCCCCCCC